MAEMAQAAPGTGRKWDAKGLARAAMDKACALPDTLMGGTPAMRAAGETYLPKESAEGQQDYDVRREATVLYGAFRNTARRHSARPFTKPITIETKTEEGLPEALAAIEDDADYSGTSLTQFARTVFEDAVVHGLAHILVDYPGEAPETAAAERTSGQHPYFAHITSANVLGWKTRKSQTGREELIEVRIREPRIEAQEDGTETEAVYIRVFTLVDGAEGGAATVQWQLYRKKKDGKDEFEAIGPAGVMARLSAIPLVTVYFNRTGFLCAEPPLDDLAWLNLAHWQSWSDQRNILHVARVPVLYETGVSDEDIAKKLEWGARRAIRRTQKDANLRYVEPDGGAIEHGRQDLLDLEARMEVLGLQPLIERQATNTALGQGINEERSICEMQAWVRSEEGGLAECYAFAAQLVGVGLPDEFCVDIFDDFALPARAATDLATLLTMRQTRQISHATFLAEVKRRDVLSSDLDVQVEIAAVEEEGPAPSAMTLLPGGRRDEDDASQDGDDPADEEARERASEDFPKESTTPNRPAA